MKIATPKTVDGLCAPTLTTRQAVAGWCDFIDMKHHPHGACLYIRKVPGGGNTGTPHKARLVINRLDGGVCPTLSPHALKNGTAVSHLARSFMPSSAVMEITRIER